MLNTSVAGPRTQSMTTKMLSGQRACARATTNTADVGSPSFRLMPGPARFWLVSIPTLPPVARLRIVQNGMATSDASDTSLSFPGPGPHSSSQQPLLPAQNHQNLWLLSGKRGCGGCTLETGLLVPRLQLACQGTGSRTRALLTDSHAHLCFNTRQVMSTVSSGRAASMLSYPL